MNLLEGKLLAEGQRIGIVQDVLMSLSRVNC